MTCRKKSTEQPPRQRIKTGPTSHMVRAKANVKRVIFDQAMMQLQKHLLPVKQDRSVGQIIGMYAYYQCLESSRRILLRQAYERERE